MTSIDNIINEKLELIILTNFLNNDSISSKQIEFNNY